MSHTLSVLDRHRYLASACLVVAFVIGAAYLSRPALSAHIGKMEAFTYLFDDETPAAADALATLEEDAGQ